MNPVHMISNKERKDLHSKPIFPKACIYIPDIVLLFRNIDSTSVLYALCNQIDKMKFCSNLGKLINDQLLN
jgi:hypothetical protein